MGGNHALGAAGGAGGEQDVADIVGGEGSERGVDGRVIGSAGGEEGRPVAVKTQDAAQVGQVFISDQCRVIGAEEVMNGTQDRHMGAAQDVAGFAALQPRVERHDGSAGDLRAQGRDDPVAAVWRPDSDAVAVPCAGGDEGGGGGTGMAPERDEGPGFAGLDDCRRIAEKPGGGLGGVRDGKGQISIHRHNTPHPLAQAGVSTSPAAVDDAFASAGEVQPSDDLEQAGGTHAASDAHRHHDALGTAALALDQRMADEP